MPQIVNAVFPRAALLGFALAAILYVGLAMAARRWRGSRGVWSTALVTIAIAMAYSVYFVLSGGSAPGSPEASPADTLAEAVWSVILVAGPVLAVSGVLTHHTARATDWRLFGRAVLAFVAAFVTTTALVIGSQLFFAAPA